MTASLPSLNIFSRYDIRGIAGVTLTDAHMHNIGRAFAASLRDAGQRAVVVAQDARPSSPDLCRALVEALIDSGIDVVNLGSAPTPLAYFASEHLGIPNSAVVTASHNPAEYNGLKLILNGRPLHGAALRELYYKIARTDFAYGVGHLNYIDVLPAYLARVRRDASVPRKMHLGVDCGNGVAGIVAPQLLRRLGCEVTELYCEPDGRFPNHHPNPAQPENLKALQKAVIDGGLDLGLAFDGDGDRIGVIDSRGKIIWPDRLMMLFAAEILERHPGCMVIYDVKSTNLLGRFIARHGGEPLMYLSGYSLLRERLTDEPRAQLAGELSGHLFFKDRWYGFDDAFYAAARLLELLARDERPSAEVFADLPEAVGTPELHLAFDSIDRAHQFVHQLARRHGGFHHGRVTDMDGLRVDYPDGWGLVRASNTTPCLTLRFEGDDATALARIQNIFRQEIRRIDPKLQFPF